MRSKAVKLLKDQRREQLNQQADHIERKSVEGISRQCKYRSGFWGLVDRLTGKRRKIKEQNEQEEIQSRERDNQEKKQLILQHLSELETHRKRADLLKRFSEKRRSILEADIREYDRHKNAHHPKPTNKLRPKL